MSTLTTTTTIGGPGLPGRVRQPAAGGLSLTGADIWRIIRQRMVLIIVLWLFLTAATIVFTFAMKFYYPEYSAFALIRVDSLAPPDVTEPLKRVDVNQQEIEREVQNQAMIIKSPGLLESALKEPELQATEWYRWAVEEAKRKNDSITDLLSDIVSASAIRDSNLLRVGAVWKNPEEVKTIVNTIVNKYVSTINQIQRDAIRQQEEQLATELGRAQETFNQQKRDIEEFRRNADFSLMSKEQTSESVLTLTALVTEITAEMLGFKTQFEALKETKPEQLPITAELQAILDNDPIISQAKRSLQIAEENLAQARARFGENHRTVQQYKKLMDAAAEKLYLENAQKVTSYQGRQIDQAKRNFLEAQEQKFALQQQLFDAQMEQQDREAKRARYDSMQDDLEIYRLQFEKMQENKNRTSLILRQRKAVQIEPQSMAVKPMRMSSPNVTVWIGTGSFLGLALSLGLAFLLELTDKSVRTPRDVSRTHIPVLGTIPSTDDDEVDIERVETACLDAPHSIVAEAFRALRANLFFSAPAEQQGVILVTSPSGGNGKTTIATNLAISIALSGRRVLLIDSNFRRPSLPRIFPNMRPEGLSNVLIGQNRLEELVTETNVPGLHVLNSGPTPPNPAELLGSSYLRDVIVDARSLYDQVIFDGPPVLLVSDTMVLAGAVDGCLMVCQYRVTSRGALQRSQSSLEAIGARVFGAVLNQVQTRAGGYFRKAYREFYDYHEFEDETGTQRPKLNIGHSPSGPNNGSAPEIAATAAAAANALEGAPEALSGPNQDRMALAEEDLAAAEDVAPAASTESSEDDVFLQKVRALQENIMKLESPDDAFLDGPAENLHEGRHAPADDLGDQSFTDPDEEIQFLEDDLGDLEIKDNFDLGEDFGETLDDERGPDKPRK